MDPLSGYRLGVWESRADKAAGGHGVTTSNTDQAVQTKIRYVWVEFSIKEDVGRFDAAVDIFPWAAFVQVSKPTGCALGNSQPGRPG